MAASTTALTLGIKDLYATGTYSDLTIKCGEREFKVHKAILDPQSSVFRKLLGGEFKEATENHATIPLDDDEPPVMANLLHFLYNFTYFDPTNGWEAPAVFAVKVYAIADKYDVPALRALAASKANATADPTTDLEAFISVIRLIDEVTNPADSTLWDIIMPKIKSSIGTLADDKDFFALVQEMPGLNRKLLKAGAKKVEVVEEECREDLVSAPRNRPQGRHLG